MLPLDLPLRSRPGASSALHCDPAVKHCQEQIGSIADIFTDIIARRPGNRPADSLSSRQKERQFSFVLLRNFPVPHTFHNQNNIQCDRSVGGDRRGTWLFRTDDVSHLRELIRDAPTGGSSPLWR